MATHWKWAAEAPAEFEVFRLINHAHAPATELTRDAVVRDDLADHAKRAMAEAQASQ